MFDTSKDILYLVLAFCILWLTIFMCWLLYYFISIVGGVRKIVKSLADKIEKIDRLIETLKDKIEHSTSYLMIIMESVSKLMDYFKNKKNDWMDNNDEPEEKPIKKSAKKIKAREE